MNERDGFEQYIRGWPTFVPKMLDRDSRYPDYYQNTVVQGAWEGRKHRGDWEERRGSHDKALPDPWESTHTP